MESVESVNTHTANLLEDVKYFHNAALSYQDAYEALQAQQVELQTKFTEQAQLVQEASDALRANEAESAACQQELVSELTTLRNQREADIQQAVGQAVVQYHDQLSSARQRNSSRIESTSNRSIGCRSKSMHWRFHWLVRQLCLLLLLLAVRRSCAGKYLI